MTLLSQPLRRAGLRFSNARSLAWFAVLVALLLWVPVLTGLQFPPKMDEGGYHVPNILNFVDHFPTVAEMRDTGLAMGPLFHGVMGRLARWTGTDLPQLRLWMMVIGALAVGIYAAASRQISEIDWRAAVLALAAFPYFGVCYFVVMTDYPAFLALTGAWFAQLWFLRTGRERALWLAGVSGLVACLIRQNLIFVPAVFLLFLLAREWSRLGNLGKSDGPRWRWVPPLVLPFLGTAFQYWLWGGLLPAAFASRDDFHPDARLYSLAIVSVSANIGYYMIPATAALAFARRIPKHRWILLALVAATITFSCYLVRGPQLVTTFGTYLHALTFLRVHLGLAVSMFLMGISILSFSVLVTSAWSWLQRPEPGRDGRRLVGALFVGALLALSFGMFRIYERHILPAYALSVLILFGVAASERSRVMRAGTVAMILFGGAHEILYAVGVYELLP